jgi:hypothetical protein
VLEEPQPPTSRDLEFFMAVTSAEPHNTMQKELYDLIRDLELSKNKAQLLSSRLQQWNHFDNTVQERPFCSCLKDFEQFFKTQGELVLGTSRARRFAINIRYKPEQRHLFRNSSMYSLSAVLFHKGNILSQSLFSLPSTKRKNTKHEGSSQLCDLQDIPITYWW